MDKKLLSKESFFKWAQPVWPEGRELELNLTVGFRAEIGVSEAGGMLLKIAAASIYRFYINGIFCGHGPSVAAHGHYRVDTWDLSEKLHCGSNWIAIEVAGYNANSYYLLDQPSFLQAEIQTADGEVIASTGSGNCLFQAAICSERIQKTQRYSFQRTFMEAFRLTPGYDDWRSGSNESFKPVTCACYPEKKLIPRRVKYPDFDIQRPVAYIQRGRIEKGVKPEAYFRPGMMTSTGPLFKGYRLDELESAAYDEYDETRIIEKEQMHVPYDNDSSISLSARTFGTLDFGINLTGFIGIQFSCREDSRLLIVFDEILTDEDVCYHRGCINVIGMEIKPGDYVVETMQPYVMRYLKLVLLEGSVELEDVYLREYANPDVKRAFFNSGHDRLDKVFEAGVDTFRQNTPDIFMDCPSRERTGFLCDSFFTARTAFNLSGNTLVEKGFIENFLLPERFPCLPEGMLPMCYPADHNNGNFIPNWALWFVIELEEYLERSGDREMVDALKPRVMQLFEYFRRFLNEDGLLEKLEKWIFIEWSEANKLVQDVNYPTNMLYAAALKAASKLYDMEKLSIQAESIRETIRSQSFQGDFFVDNAVREDGILKLSGKRTEVCQYYAFFFDVATPESHPSLWEILVDQFGPCRKKTGAYPEIYPANAFIGNYLRLELLSRQGLSEQIMSESVDYLYFMAQRTGTLWEHDNPGASCNHGFASHIVHVCYRDILGVYKIDPVNKQIKLRFCKVSLESCQGCIPVGEDEIRLKWHKKDGCLYYSLNLPDNYVVDVANLTEMKIERILI